MRHLRYILGIILMLLVVILMVQNHEPMSTGVVFRVDILSINYHSPRMTLYHVVTISFLFGVLITGFYGIAERFRLKKEINTLVSTSQERDKELNSLRNLPITIDDVPSGEPNST